MLYKKEQLLVPEPMLKRRLEFIRGEYDRQHAAGEKQWSQRDAPIERSPGSASRPATRQRRSRRAV